jgi:hypothetical protein
MVIVSDVELLPQFKALDVAMSLRNINLIAVAMLAFLSGVGIFSHPLPACADYYKYRDNKGIICITNNLNAIPPQYRSTMKVIREDKPGRLERGNQTQTTPEVSAVVREPAAGHNRPAATSSQSDSPIVQLLARFPLIKLLIMIAVIVAASIIIVKLTSLIPSPQLARLINIVFFLGLFVFAYKLYADNLVGNYFTIKTKILGIFARANVREAPEAEAKPLETTGESAVK